MSKKEIGFNLKDNEIQAKLATLMLLSQENGGYVIHDDITDEFQIKEDEDNFHIIVVACQALGFKVLEEDPTSLTGNFQEPQEQDEQDSSEPSAPQVVELGGAIIDKSAMKADSTRQYMRDMGKIDLLTREEETKVAQKIEEGTQMMLRGISACPMSIEMILADAQ